MLLAWLWHILSKNQEKLYKNPIKLFEKVEKNNKISYKNFTSLYPYTNFITTYPVGHPEFKVF